MFFDFFIYYCLIGKLFQGSIGKLENYPYLCPLIQKEV